MFSYTLEIEQIEGARAFESMLKQNQTIDLSGNSSLQRLAVAVNRRLERHLINRLRKTG